MVLEKIQKENDIKKLTPEELELLKDEIRQFLIESISVTGGHLASNLGVVDTIKKRGKPEFAPFCR